MNIDENLINELIEKEVKSQVNNRINAMKMKNLYENAVKEVVREEVSRILYGCQARDFIVEFLNNNKIFRNEVASQTANILYNSLQYKEDDDYDY